jgi:hypothetical protein
MKPRRRPWTSDEDAALVREVIAGRSLDAIAAELGRTKSAVQNRVYALGLTLKKCPKPPNRPTLG